MEEDEREEGKSHGPDVLEQAKGGGRDGAVSVEKPKTAAQAERIRRKKQQQKKKRKLA